jgi:hypothetical protein
MRERLESDLKINGFEQEPMFARYLSIINEGGAIHNQLDLASPGKTHLRFNIFLQLPENGGYPIIQGKTS